MAQTMRQRLSQAHCDIDAEFGRLNYARGNPQLVAACLQVEAPHELRIGLAAALDTLAKTIANLRR